MSLHTVRLEDVAELNPATPRGLLGSNEEVAFVPMAAVSETGAMRVEAYRPACEVSSGLSYFAHGDVLVAKITPCFENNKIALAKIDRRHAFGSTEFHVLRPDARHLDARYLSHFLRQDAIREQGKRRMTGSGGQRRVPRAFLQELTIPLPPLDEQRRIAAILDQADLVRRNKARAVSRLDDLAQSVFRQIIGDPLTNSLGWRNDQRLGEVAEIASGITKGRKLNGARTRAIPYLAVANVQDRFLALGNVKEIEATEGEVARYRLRRDDLLLTEGGDPDKLGRGVLWKEELPEAIHQNHVFRVRLTSAELNPIFLNWLIGSSRGKRYFLRSAKQTTGIASINMEQLKQFPLLVPPIEVQERFATAIATIENQTVIGRRSLARLDALFASLQHRAFTGELTRSDERLLETA